MIRRLLDAVTGRLSPRTVQNLRSEFDTSPLTKVGVGILAVVLVTAVFAPLLALGLAGVSSLLLTVGTYGVAVNLLLAAFNLIPFGPLDGATVRAWSTPVWLAAFLPSAALAVGFAVTLLF